MDIVEVAAMARDVGYIAGIAVVHLVLVLTALQKELL